MKPVELKVARIGNSRGIRIPASTLARYHIGDSVVMEEHAEGILLRPRRVANAKLSWEDTALAMAHASEDWSDWDATLADGLASLNWDDRKPAQAAESGSRYSIAGPRKKRAKP